MKKKIIIGFLMAGMILGGVQNMYAAPTVNGTLKDTT